MYERGIDLYNYPVAFEIWNIYLSKFVSRYVSPLNHLTRRINGLD